MQLLLRAIALILGLLFTRTAYGQDPHDIEHITDTEERHFEDYWRQANEALLTTEGRARLDRGQTRLSLRAMSNPVRYGLIAPARAHEALTAAGLLCDNRDTGSLQLRCRMTDEPRPRRVRLTDANCAGRPDLFTLIPVGCEHPYVMTIEGRRVALQRRLPPAPSNPLAEPADRINDPPDAEHTLNELRSEITSLRNQVRDLTADRAELRHEQQQTDALLNRSYLALLFLVGLILTAAVIVWRQRDNLGSTLEENASLRDELSVFTLESTRNSQASLRLRASQLQAKDSHLAGLQQEAREYIGALLARNKALENELRSHKDRPSVIIDDSVFRVEEVAAEAETQARQSMQELREAQAIERASLQNKIEELRAEEARLQRELRIRHAAYTNYVAQLEQRIADAETQSKEARRHAENADEKAAALATTNAQLTDEQSATEEVNRRLRLANRSLKSLIDRVSRYFHECGLESPDWFVFPGTDPLNIPTPPSTRTAPPPSHPPTHPPTEVTTAVIGVPVTQPLAGPLGAMTTGRQTLTGVGDDSALYGSKRNTLRLPPEAGTPTPTPEDTSSHARTTPPPKNYFGTEPSDSGTNPLQIDALHPPLSADQGDTTNIWIMSEHDGSAISLAQIPRPAALPVIQEADDQGNPQQRAESPLRATTRKMSFLEQEQVIAKAENGTS